MQSEYLNSFELDASTFSKHLFISFMLRTIQKKNKDRYRTQFCDSEFYLKHQDTFKMWKSLFAEFKDVEKLTAWVVALSALRRPLDWYQGPNTTPVGVNKTHQLAINELFARTDVQIPKKISPQTDLYSLIVSHNIKALPHACLRSLCNVVSCTYPVLITERVPTPHELLRLQISGQRIISLNENYSSWPETLYSGRDFLGFLIHDLLHADHFFRDSSHRDGQLGVYRFIQRLLTDESLNSLLLSDARFREGFEYIISDMNSHPVHLFQTLHSLLFSSLKDDVLALSVWGRWIDLNSGSSELLRINTREFSTGDALMVESYCQSHGAGVF